MYFVFPFQEPVKSAIVDSCIRVMDNGRESIHRKVGTTVYSFCDDVSICHIHNLVFEDCL